MSKRLTFGIDFDDTITADEKLMAQLIRCIVRARHKVYIVTARAEERQDNTDILMFLDKLPPDHIVDVIYCSAMSKIAVTRDLGIKIDIWWDDFPELLVLGLDKARNVRSQLWRDHPIDKP